MSEHLRFSMDASLGRLGEEPQTPNADQGIMELVNRNSYDADASQMPGRTDRD